MKKSMIITRKKRVSMTLGGLLILAAATTAGIFVNPKISTANDLFNKVCWSHDDSYLMYTTNNNSSRKNSRRSSSLGPFKNPRPSDPPRPDEIKK